MSDSLRPHGLYSPWNSPGQNTREDLPSPGDRPNTGIEFRKKLLLNMGFMVTQTVKNPPTMRETWVQFLDWEDPPEEGMATHSRILAWRIPWTEEPGRL